jgi:hypothetical protein
MVRGSQQNLSLYCRNGEIGVKRWITGCAALLVAVALGACSQAGPLRSITKGDELAVYNFERGGTFEEGAYEDASLLARNGVYRIDVREGDNVLWWGQGGEQYDNVVIEVDVEQLSERNENAYGVMCRVRGNVQLPTGAAADAEATAEATEGVDATEAADAGEATEAAADEADATEAADDEAEATAAADEAETATEEADEGEATETADEATEAAADEADATEAAGDGTEATEAATAEAESTELAPVAPAEVSNGDGYLFLIQGNGAFAIMRSRGRNVTPLVNWTTNAAIRVGPGANKIRAICAGNYLALYVNDQFMGDATDDTYTRGQVGLVASAANRLGVRVEFDNLTVSSVAGG